MISFNHNHRYSYNDQNRWICQKIAFDYKGGGGNPERAKSDLVILEYTDDTSGSPILC